MTKNKSSTWKRKNLIGANLSHMVRILRWDKCHFPNGCIQLCSRKTVMILEIKNRSKVFFVEYLFKKFLLNFKILHFFN